MHALLRSSNNLKFLAKSIEPDFLSWADEMAEPRPDINIKVATFTVAE